MWLLLLVPVMIIAIISWLHNRRNPLSRTILISILMGVGYWYVLPGVIFFKSVEIQGADSNLLQFDNHILHAIWLVFFSLALLLIIPAAMRKIHVLRTYMQQHELNAFNERRLSLFLYFTFISAVALLVFRFADMGPIFALNLLMGHSTARAAMSFENISGDIGNSLMALWEILTVFASIFLTAIFTWLRQTLSMRFLIACASNVFVFASSGTRAVLLLMAISVVISLMSRPRIVFPHRTKTHILRLSRKLLTALLLGGLVVVSALVMMARFENDTSQAGRILLNSVVFHNDMFRELLFSIVHGEHYRSDGLSLLQTPLNFAMPSFMGFEKSIPPHLIDFNYDRAGIDLLYGVGNVFPGIIADMYLCFDEFGPLVFAVQSAIFIYIFWFVTLRRNHSAIASALFVALLAYYVISFRNLQGSLAIVVIVSYILVSLFSQLKPLRLVVSASLPTIQSSSSSSHTES